MEFGKQRKLGVAVHDGRVAHVVAGLSAESLLTPRTLMSDCEGQEKQRTSNEKITSVTRIRRLYRNLTAAIGVGE